MSKTIVNSTGAFGLDADPANVRTASYTVQFGDADEDRIVQMNVAGANTVTIPPNSTVPFPVSAVITVEQIGAGTTTIVAGSGVTINSSTGLAIGTQFGFIKLIQTSANVWNVMSDLAPGAPPTGTAGGDLTGTYPNPTLAVDRIPKDGSYAAATTDVGSSRVTADTNPRFTWNADGKLEGGPGNAALDMSFGRSGVALFDVNTGLASQIRMGAVTGGPGLLFGVAGDTNLYRAGAGELKTDGFFEAGSNIYAVRGDSKQVIMGSAGPGTESGISFSSGEAGCSLYRSAAGTLKFTGHVAITDAKNIVLDTTTGSKIGTATDEKLAFHNSTPVIQRVGAAQAAVVTTAAQLAGFGYATQAQADAIVTLVNEIRAALTEKGLIKGAA